MRSSTPKRILMVIRWPGGGIRTFVRYIYRNIDSSKWKLTIITPLSDGIEILEQDLNNLNVNFIPVKGMPTDGSSGAALFFKKIFQEVKKGRYDLIHSQGFIAGACCALPALLNRIPHLMTTHDVLNTKQFIGAKGVYKRQILGTIFESLTAIHSVSYDANDNLIVNFPGLGKKGNSIVIHNGIDVKRFADAIPRNLRKELMVGKDVFLIGYLGRFVSLKGFKYLIGAIDLLKKHPLPKKPLVLTFGAGCFANREWQVIKERGLEKYFDFMPFTPNIASTIKGLDIVVMPSLSEACPLVPMETLVCGTPIIGTDCIGLREVLQSTPAQVVPKANATALAKALLLEMEFNRKEIFMKFRNEAAKRFDVTRTCNSLFQVYEDLIHSGYLHSKKYDISLINRYPEDAGRKGT